MRGKHDNGIQDWMRYRITPAHAGKTAKAFGYVRTVTDHPRACGENLDLKFCSGVMGGSPPRMRGKPSGITGVTSEKRITPAHAGKTLPNRKKHEKKKDHPRACGENFQAQLKVRQPPGSPPRMRGKPLHAFFSINLRRITPAHAGKTNMLLAVRKSIWDHPRACGENAQMGRMRDVNLGSPPRMRGKHHRLHLLFIFERITPAHAGKTFSSGCPHRC